MTDTYTRVMRTPVVGGLAKRAGAPSPPALERFSEGAPVVAGKVLLGAAAGGRLAAPLAKALRALGASAVIRDGDPGRQLVGDAKIGSARLGGENGTKERFKALVVDASGIEDSTDLVALHDFLYPSLPNLDRCGRILVLGTPPEATGSVREHAAQRALEGLTRSLGKEVGRRGATAQLVYVAAGAEDAMDSTLRFLLSPRSAYVSGQVIRLTAPPKGAGVDLGEFDWKAPLQGRTALVTGAARGIGAAIATVLARDGAAVTGLDVAGAQADLTALMSKIGGSALEVDITSPDAPEAIAAHFPDGLDVVVHNAGVTRDRTLAKMPAERWTMVLDINLSSEERINDALLAAGKLRPNGRIVCVSSIAGIAGNGGQTNYATSKAGVIGMVQALAPVLAKEHGVTINAVAPGFIETQMTAAIPFAIREAGRRMNSLLQGGLPVDVAETIAWYASPASSALNGNVVRVCGQSLLGA
jgi:3-oxoacyl-[acyl-carrier protein] reductase